MIEVVGQGEVRTPGSRRANGAFLLGAVAELEQDRQISRVMAAGCRNRPTRLSDRADGERGRPRLQ